MNEILKHFEKIASTPHCSFNAHKLKDEIISYATKLGYEVQTDKHDNILCTKGNPKVCLQSHYDMVCIGDAPHIELELKENILKAKNSTLGADNGMGMSIMFACMSLYEDFECLFTSDEEVGLIGATNLELQLTSKYLLNLDGEQEDEIYIGCAGGVDVISTCKVQKLPLGKEYAIYELVVENLPGGHSGVDIDKNIPSAIKVLANELAQQEDIKLLHVEGGEMRNSIPKKATAIIASNQAIKVHNEMVKVTKKSDFQREYLENSDTIIRVLDAFAQGVRAFDKEFMIPSISINLGKIRQSDENLQIDCNVRAMKDTDLDRVAKESISLFELANFEVKIHDRHEAWSPNVGEFTLLVKDVMSQTYEGIELKAIHAGLECGVLMQTQKQSIEAVSIGPTIRFPHSLREECDMASVDRIYKIVKQIIERV